MYTQGLYILCTTPISPDELGARLRRMNVLSRHQPVASEHWSRSADGWVVQYAGHPRGKVIIDTISRPWPDTFSRDEDPSLYASWSMGFFGVGVTPGALARATEAVSEELAESIHHHSGFIRLRMSYTPESGEPLIPEERSAQDELAYLTRAAYFILEDESAIALFSPSGEVITKDSRVWQIYERAFGESGRMWRLWIGTRLKPAEDTKGELHLMGMSALGLKPTRLVFDPDILETKEVQRTAQRLIDALGADIHADEFSDRAKRAWYKVEAEEPYESTSTWRCDFDD